MMVRFDFNRRCKGSVEFGYISACNGAVGQLVIGRARDICAV
jgi:hypothetical protein